MGRFFYSPTGEDDEPTVNPHFHFYKNYRKK